MSPLGNGLPGLSFFRAHDRHQNWAIFAQAGGKIFRIPGALSKERRAEEIRLGLAGVEALAEEGFPCNLAWVEANGEVVSESELSLLGSGPQAAAVVKPGKIIALGRTFPAHVSELGNEPAKEPLVFSKCPSNVIGSGDPLLVPWQVGERFDNEIELAAVLSKGLKCASAADAEEGVFGWCMVNDFTWRSEQSRAKNAGAPWYISKNLPGCLPVGPRLVPRASLTDPRDLTFSCRINDQEIQAGDFRGMSQSPYELLSWLSFKVDLNPGDLIALGTPKGVTQVQPQDRIETSIEQLGTLHHTVVQKEFIS